MTVPKKLEREFATILETGDLLEGYDAGSRLRHAEVVETNVTYKPGRFGKFCGAKEGPGIKTQEIELTAKGFVVISEPKISAMEGVGAMDIYDTIIKAKDRIDYRRMR